MSHFEKIALLCILVGVTLGSIFSFHEITEPRDSGTPRVESRSDYDDSVGDRLHIGSFTSIVTATTSGGIEDNCVRLQPVIVAVLHDIAVRLGTSTRGGQQGEFEVTPQVVGLFCEKHASLTMANAQGDMLLLQKAPFVRVAPENTSSAEVGSEVRIAATLVRSGVPTSTTPTVVGDLLVPDQFLDDSAHAGQ